MAEESGAGGRGNGGGDAYEFALVDALGRLSPDAEPPMPDLVPGATARGRRIRRRRRIGVALSTVATVAAMVVGGYAVLPSTVEERSPSPPAAEPSVWYPSLGLLRSVVTAKSGTVEPADPKRPDGERRYFRWVDTSGRPSYLYVSVERSTTGQSLLPSGPVGCRDGVGRTLTTPWGGRLTKCAVVPRKEGDNLLEYFVRQQELPGPKSDASDDYAMGVAYVTSGGWTVQAIASETGENRRHGREYTDSVRQTLYRLATDPRLFDAVKETGG
ncbi:hypothetical protein O3Q52_06245 [Streptomyces sp. ActVer]|uniref:hypothetical protein n=1 Tax=Streptomyces sp. ActVer TaxID=3014558 RepID=UPI0022B4A599|nr:hypothetical protein [Streptomyces sp. ActVer]MCZ4507812.1 hypothetical protein [Streptomyces sp. ActVer]